MEGEVTVQKSRKALKPAAILTNTYSSLETWNRMGHCSTELSNVGYLINNQYTEVS